jgi:hypothetical protein
MTTGYEKILALIDKKNEKEVSEVSSRISNGINLINSETTLKPQGFRAAGLSVSGEQPTSSSLPDEAPDWIEEIIELALAGQITEAVLVPVLPAYHNILGQRVWFCPDPLTAEMKTPDLAFTSEELIVIIPLLIENREFASTLVSAKRIFGGTIMGSSLNLPTAEPHDGQAGAKDRPEPGEGAPLDQDTSHRQDAGGTPSPRKGLPGPGRHLVIIRSVKGYLHNFPEYTGPRARLEMEIMEGPDVGKILVDNVSLLHPKESKGMCQRRVRIAYRLGLISGGTDLTVPINWKLLEGEVCWVDVAHRQFKGRPFVMVDNYQLPSVKSDD